MKFKIAMLLLLLAAVAATPYVLQRKGNNSLLNDISSGNLDILSTEQTRQTYYKWQDAKGQWHMGEVAPQGVKAIAMNIDTAANILRSTKVVKTDTSKASKAQPQHSAAQPTLPVPLTVSPDKVTEIMDKAQNVQNIMDKRAAQLEQIR